MGHGQAYWQVIVMLLGEGALTGCHRVTNGSTILTKAESDGWSGALPSHALKPGWKLMLFCEVAVETSTTSPSSFFNFLYKDEVCSPSLNTLIQLFQYPLELLHFIIGDDMSSPWDRLALQNFSVCPHSRTVS